MAFQMSWGCSPIGISASSYQNDCDETIKIRPEALGSLLALFIAYAYRVHKVPQTATKRVTAAVNGGAVIY